MNTPVHKPFTAKDLERLMKKIWKENELIDDHGPAIIGGRDKLPVTTTDP